jgi:hypothetical protein
MIDEWLIVKDLEGIDLGLCIGKCHSRWPGDNLKTDNPVIS